MIDIEKLKQCRPSSKNFQKVSIYKIPDAYTTVEAKEGRKHMYSPMLVGLGHYHHKDGGLSGLQTLKHEALYRALTRMQSSFKKSHPPEVCESISDDPFGERSRSINTQETEEETQNEVQNSTAHDESPRNKYHGDDSTESGEEEEEEEDAEEINGRLLELLLVWLRKEVCHLKGNIEDAYADEFKFDPDKFILDSCLLLEVGYTMGQWKNRHKKQCLKDVNCHAVLHPKKLKVRSLGFVITLDFIKLENQLPMELLRMMHDLQTPEEPEEAFFKSMYAIISGHIPSASKNLPNMARKLLFPKKNPPRHLLEWLQRICVEIWGFKPKRHDPSKNPVTSVNDYKCGCTRSLTIEVEKTEERTRCEPEAKEQTKGKEPDEERSDEKVRKAWWIPSARELSRAGIEIVAAEALNFKGGFQNWRGRLEIPKVKLNEGSEAVLRNIIAFEEQAVQKNVVSRFVRVMDNLINKEEDVSKLIDTEVLEHSLGSDSQVSRLFNSMSEHITKKPHSRIDKKMMMVKNYYKNSGRVMLIEFFRVYFSRPWYFVAFLAATIGLLCTILSTVYTIKNKAKLKLTHLR